MKELIISGLKLKSNFLLAPLAGYADLAFRKTCRENGCTMAYTEMVSVNGLVFSTEKTKELIIFDQTDRPLGLQLFGSEPDRFSAALDKIELKDFDLVDINCGCPVKKVIKNRSGVALMRSVENLSKIIKTVRAKVKIPLTIKIRAGWDNTAINALEIAKMAENEGIDAITIHPRTRTEGFNGPIHYDLAGELVKNLKIPVILSGNIDSPLKAEKLHQDYGFQGFMIGRPTLGNPWIFKQFNSWFYGQAKDESRLPSLEEKYQTILVHLKETIKTRGEKDGILFFRKHIVKYIKHLPDSSYQRAIFLGLRSYDDIISTLNRYFDKLNSEPLKN